MSVQRLRQLADRLCQRRIRFGKLRSCPGNNNLIGMETVVHQLANRFGMEQFFRIPIEQQIDATHVNPKMVSLREKYAIRPATRNGLMSMTGDECRGIRKFGS